MFQITQRLSVDRNVDQSSAKDDCVLVISLAAAIQSLWVNSFVKTTPLLTDVPQAAASPLHLS